MAGAWLKAPIAGRRFDLLILDEDQPVFRLRRQERTLERDARFRLRNLLRDALNPLWSPRDAPLGPDSAKLARGREIARALADGCVVPDPATWPPGCPYPLFERD